MSVILLPYPQNAINVETRNWKLESFVRMETTLMEKVVNLIVVASYQDTIVQEDQ